MNDMKQSHTFKDKHLFDIILKYIYMIMTKITNNQPINESREKKNISK